MAKTKPTARNRPTFPIDQFLNTLVEMLVDSIDSFSSSVGDHSRRAVVSHALLRMECTNKANRDVLVADGRLRYYRFFYHTLSTNSLLPRRFLDSTFGVSLLTGSYGDGPSNVQRFGVLTPKDVLQDRMNTARRLASLDLNHVVLKSAKYMPGDLPACVGPRVAAFVGRTRFLTQLRAQARPEWVVECGFRSCRCRFLCSDVAAVQSSNPALVDLLGESPASSDDDDDDASSDEDCLPGASYWAQLCPRPFTSLPRRVFCSLACSLAYDDEIISGIPIRVSDAETHETSSSARGKLGLPRLLASTRAAFKRNDSAARALRESMRCVKRRPHQTVKTEIFAKMHSNIIDVLNIDLGLLYAAAFLAESPEACVNRQLPATSPSWRDGDVRRFTRAILRVQSLYLEHHKAQDGLARDERFPPKWLLKVREAAPGLFPAKPSL